jgi:hypothetical protein
LTVAQRSASDVIATPDGHALIAAFIGRLSESLTLWLALIFVAVLFVALPAAFLSRRGREEAVA